MCSGGANVDEVVVLVDGVGEAGHHALMLEMLGENFIESDQFTAGHCFLQFSSNLEQVQDHHEKFIFHVFVGWLANIKEVEVLGDLCSEVVGVLSVTVAQVSNAVGETVAVVLEHSGNSEI